MSTGLPDLVDCALLAEQSAVFERVYPLRDLPRLQEMLAQQQGSLSVRFAFEKLGRGRLGATLAFEAVPEVVCQRCLQGFPMDLSGGSKVEFAGDDDASTESEREFFRMRNGLVSLARTGRGRIIVGLADRSRV